MTGTVGIRPTVGRWSTDGIVPLSPALDTAGVLARSVADMTIGFGAIDPSVEEDAVTWTRRLATADLADFHVGCATGISRIAIPASPKASSPRSTSSHGPACAVAGDDPSIRAATELFRQGGCMSAISRGSSTARCPRTAPTWIRRSQFVSRNGSIAGIGASTARAPSRRDVARGSPILRRLHALVGPTLPLTPPDMAAIAGPETISAKLAAGPQHQHREPVGNVRSYAAGGPRQCRMPVGLHIVARGGDEETALALALACERVLGRARDRIGTPPMCGT